MNDPTANYQTTTTSTTGNGRGASAGGQPGHARSSVEIKEDIDRTRSSMDETLDALTHRLRPRNLLDEVFDWAAYKLGRSGGRHGAHSDSDTKASESDAAKGEHRIGVPDAVRDNAADAANRVRAGATFAGRKVAAVVRDNPVPAALIGAGIAWLLVSASRDSESRDRTDSGSGDFGNRHGARWPYGAAAPAPHRGPDDNPYATPADFTAEELRRGAHTGMSTAGPIPVGPTEEGAHDSADTEHDDAEHMSLYDHHEVGGDAQSHDRGSVEQARERARHAAARARHTAGYTREQAGEYAAEAREWSTDAVHRVRDRAGNLVSSAANRMTDAADRMRSWAHGAQDQAHSMREAAQDRTSTAMFNVRTNARSATERARHGMSAASDRMQEGATYIGQRAHDTYAVARDKTAETYEEHPLSMGIGAFAAGLIAGLVIPSTRKEQEWMGDSAEDMRHWAAETSREAMRRTGTVAERAAHAAIDTIEEDDLAPQSVGSSLREIARAAGSAAKKKAEEEGIAPDQLKEKTADIAESVRNEAKEEAQEQAEEMKKST